jgi:hypothetical protein
MDKSGGVKTKTPHQSREARQRRRDKIVAQYHQSELTQRDFAEQSGISLSTLQLWLRKSAQSETIGASCEAPVSRTQSHWIEAGILTPTSSPSSAAIELEFPDGVLLKFSSEVDPEQVVQIIRGLR